MIKNALGTKDQNAGDGTTKNGNPIAVHVFLGIQTIDGAWCTDEIEMTEARLMPYCLGVGDHRAVIIDITEQSIYGDQTFKIVRLDARSLQWKLPQSVEAYGSRLIKKMDEQDVFERMEKIY